MLHLGWNSLMEDVSLSAAVVRLQQNWHADAVVLMFKILYDPIMSSPNLLYLSIGNL